MAVFMTVPGLEWESGRGVARWGVDPGGCAGATGNGPHHPLTSPSSAAHARGRYMEMSPETPAAERSGANHHEVDQGRKITVGWGDGRRCPHLRHGRRRPPPPARRFGPPGSNGASSGSRAPRSSIACTGGPRPSRPSVTCLPPAPPSAWDSHSARANGRSHGLGPVRPAVGAPTGRCPGPLARHAA